MADIKNIFSEDGLLSQRLPGFIPRALQSQMALAIHDALKHSQILVAEAGTGTGKTYAYLVPSLLSGKKVMISTGTKNLQDQLFHRDLPLIRQILGVPIKVSLLKGRSNYLCLHRLNIYSRADFLPENTLNILNEIQRWADYAIEGEIEHIPFLKPDTTFLPYVTSTGDNCLGQDCEFYQQCFLLKARREAQDADLLVVNHHLFFADSQLKEQGISELLPDTKAIIFDEAHQLHEIATHFLGESLSSRQLAYLARDIQAEQQADAKDMISLKTEAEKLMAACRSLTQAFGVFSRGAWENIVHKPDIKAGLLQVQEILIALYELLEVSALRGRGLENCLKRTADIRAKFDRLTALFPEEQIHWYEVQQNSFSIHHTPLNVAGYFSKVIAENPRTWIFTSATLSVEGDFSHFESHLGLPDPKRLHLKSAFNYAEQAILYIPPLTAKPHEALYLQEILSYAIPILNLTQGRAFFLFTSHKALNEAAALLSTQIDYPLLIQGSMPKSQLLQQFCSQDHAILLGTNSFWEGVDVKGHHLSCVIIDKLPFLSPQDPILKSKLEYYKRQDKNPFIEYQLPHAVIQLRQGAGRLIRDINDRGVLMICDPRLRTQEYGKIFLNSLPEMPVTENFDEVSEFLNKEVKR